MRRSAAPAARATPSRPSTRSGLESMGAVDADEQAAVVRLALQSLAALDVPTVLEMSGMGYLTGLLDALHVPARGAGEAAGLPARQERPRAAHCCAGYRAGRHRKPPH